MKAYINPNHNFVKGYQCPECGLEVLVPVAVQHCGVHCLVCLTVSVIPGIYCQTCEKRLACIDWPTAKECSS